MRLFVLKPCYDSDNAKNIYGWTIYCGTYEIAVLAENEDRAREIADKHEASTEGWGRSGMWLDKYSTNCREITTDLSGVVLAADGTG